MDVAALRKELGLKSIELAAKLGVSRSHMSMIEHKNRNLTLKQAAKLEEISGRSGIVEAVVAERVAA